MQPSPNARLKPGATTSPRSPSHSEQERGSSPRKAPVRLASRSPNSHPELNADLRMNDFYTIDSSFKSLRDALKPDPKTSPPFAPAPALLDLAGAIESGTRAAEKSFKLRNYMECHQHLSQAKAGQVQMLTSIDDTPVEMMSAHRRTGLRSSCEALGKALTERMLKAKSAQLRSEDVLDDEGTRPTSPSRSPLSRREQPASPPRSSQKRAQGDADSPVLAQSPPKRQKAETGSPVPAGEREATSPTRTAATATTTTATPTTAPPSLPSYQPVPQLHIVHEASVTAAGAADPSAASASNAIASPPRRRTLSPQARPRPRSHLFAAPPDFTNQVPDKPAASPSKAPPGNRVGQPQPDTDRSARNS
jgi:hypothetical protein